jgi:aerobic-type carbon monoxide dehydrogenase small subunit (CoxS/CutS family)
MDTSIELVVNGQKHTVSAEPDTSLLEVLRDDLGLTGSKYGCGESECGACTVHLDGKAVHSCVTPISDAVGKEVTTIEAFSQNGKLHPLQQAFLDEGAMQCGYCVTGMVIAGAALLAKNSHPTEAEILDHMQGNVCRCCAYPRIVAAIKRAAKAMEAVS